MRKQKYLTPVVGTAGAVAQAATVYSEAVDLRDLEDALMAIQIASTAGSITVTMEASMTGADNTWYAAQNAAGTTLSAVIATMTVGTKFIVLTPLFAPYIRFKVVEGNSAATVVTLKVMFKRRKQ